MLSRHDDVHHINQALKSGADGYVLKDEASDDLKEAIQLVGSGQMYFSPRVASHMIKGHKMREHTKYHVPEDAGNPVTGLTQREKEILILVAQAKNTKEIAAELTLSPSTVKAHRNNIMKKLNIHKVVDLVRFAIRSGYVDN
jgi:DNA-binding NarL/FixJ family response regulator